jgi:hypothetical protein
MVRNVAEPLTGKHRSSKLYHPILNFSIQISGKGTARGKNKGHRVIDHWVFSHWVVGY